MHTNAAFEMQERVYATGHSSLKYTILISTCNLYFRFTQSNDARVREAGLLVPGVQRGGARVGHRHGDQGEHLPGGMLLLRGPNSRPQGGGYIKGNI